jgi:hypothetical protein
MEKVYMVFSWNDSGEIFLYMSTNKRTAFLWAEDYYNRVQYHTWVEFQEIDLYDFCPCDYCNYIPNDESIVWEKKTNS